MNTPYQMGREAARNCLWLSEALGIYNINGIEASIEFYEGYWGPGWKVEYENGSFIFKNMR